MDTITINPGECEDAVSRMRRLQSERRSRDGGVMAGVLSAYVKSPRDPTLEAELDGLVDSFLLTQEAASSGYARQVGRLREGRALTVTGKSGAGKTRTLERHFHKREEFAGYGDPNSDCVLVSVTAPSPCTLRLLGNEILAAIGSPVERRLDENVVWDMVHRNLALRGVRFLHIDELQHVLQSRNPVEIGKVQDTLKRLMQNKDWPVWLILSGLPEIGRFFAEDEQVWRRSRHVVLDDITLAKDAEFLRRLLIDYGNTKAKLDLDGVTEDPFLGRLLHAALGQLGILIEIVQDAIREALRKKSGALTVTHFADAYKARTGCRPEANVFTAQGDWWLIRPQEGIVREEPHEDDDEEEDSEPRAGRKGKKAKKTQPRDTRNP